jgi:hypothetical protein
MPWTKDHCHPIRAFLPASSETGTNGLWEEGKPAAEQRTFN